MADFFKHIISSICKISDSFIHYKSLKHYAGNISHLIIVATVTFYSFNAFASEKTVIDSTKIIFKVSKTNIEPGIFNNMEKLDSMLLHLNRMKDSLPTYRLTTIKVEGSASPEGPEKFNEYLSQERARNIFNYLASKTFLPDSLLQHTYKGSDWSGLLGMVKKDASVPFRNDVIALLNDITSLPQPAKNSFSRLKKLHNGQPYRYMYRYLFPELRYSTLSVEYQYTPKEEIPIEKIPHVTPLPDVTETITDTLIEDIVVLPAEEQPYKVCKPFYMALKSNMLYDALALPSVGAEFYLGKNLSIAGNWTYGWWDTDRTHHYWRAYGGDLALRWWFGRLAAQKPLTGHHIGIYGGVTTYDFEFGGKGIMGGKPGGTLWDKCMRMAGIEYGFSLPVARRINIDFTLGIGYLGGHYIKYEPFGNGYKWLSTHKLNWFGPTKLEVSLVWLLGCANYNIKRGGSL